VTRIASAKEKKMKLQSFIVPTVVTLLAACGESQPEPMAPEAEMHEERAEAAEEEAAEDTERAEEAADQAEENAAEAEESAEEAEAAAEESAE
jgi:hypothetical protein